MLAFSIGAQVEWRNDDFVARFESRSVTTIYIPDALTFAHPSEMPNTVFKQDYDGIRLSLDPRARPRDVIRKGWSRAVTAPVSARRRMVWMWYSS